MTDIGRTGDILVSNCRDMSLTLNVMGAVGTENYSTRAVVSETPILPPPPPPPIPANTGISNKRLLDADGRDLLSGIVEETLRDGHIIECHQFVAHCMQKLPDHLRNLPQNQRVAIRRRLQSRVARRRRQNQTANENIAPIQLECYLSEGSCLTLELTLAPSKTSP